jgi:hypothetical protein
MADTRDLANRLVDYDERLATAILELVWSELGGPAAKGAPDVAEIRSFLTDPGAARSGALKRVGDVGESPASTSEWKSEFAHSERLRSFGAALAERLTARTAG